MNETEVEDIDEIQASEIYPKKQPLCDDENLSVPFPTLPGEGVSFLGRATEGVVALSNYRLFCCNEEAIFNIPLGLIEEVECRDMFSLYIFCKDARSFRCTFTTNEDCRKWHKRLLNVLLPPKKVEDLFGFAYYLWSKDEQYEDVYQNLILERRKSKVESCSLMEMEAERMGFNLKNGVWKISNVNADYNLCQSYPLQLLVPQTITDKDLEAIANFRYSRRIPTVVWRHKKNGAVIARSSQPQVGWFGWPNAKDENLIQAIVDGCNLDLGSEGISGGKDDICSLKSEPDVTDTTILPPDHFPKLASSKQKLLILDARSYAAAVANRAKGGGCECPDNYPNCEIQFMGLANIHSIRKSFQSLRVLCSSFSDQQNWLSMLDGTKWLHNIAGLLKAALVVVQAIDQEGRPVLVHCSDGWDRTPQIVALAELLLDPYYRTIEGFQILVEREWCDFGHKFADRCGHGPKANDPNERCPVFLQWVDCVNQLLHQFPCSFEFNSQFLMKLVLHTYSCLFGTFYCNSNKERNEQRVHERTFSVWSYLNSMPLLHNYLYVYNEQVLRPSCQLKDLQFWSQLYLPPMFSPLLDKRNQQEEPLILSRDIGNGSSLLFKTHSCDSISALDHHSGLQRHSSDPNIDRASKILDAPALVTSFNGDINELSSRVKHSNPSVQEDCSDTGTSCGCHAATVRGDGEVTESCDTVNHTHSHISNDGSTDTLVSENSASTLEGPSNSGIEGTKVNSEMEKSVSISTSTTDISNSVLTPLHLDHQVHPSHNSDPSHIKWITCKGINHSHENSIKQHHSIETNNHIVHTVHHHSRTPSSGFPATPCDDHLYESSRSHIIPAHRLDLDGLIIMHDEMQERIHHVFIAHQKEVESLRRQLYMTQLELCQQVCQSCKIKDGNGIDRSDDGASLSDSACSGEHGLESSADSSDISWEQVDVQEASATLWVPDHAASSCMGCGLKFGPVRRKHHCRSECLKAKVIEFKAGRNGESEQQNCMGVCLIPCGFQKTSG